MQLKSSLIENKRSLGTLTEKLWNSRDQFYVQSRHYPKHHGCLLLSGAAAAVLTHVCILVLRRRGTGGHRSRFAKVGRCHTLCIISAGAQQANIFYFL